MAKKETNKKTTKKSTKKKVVEEAPIEVQQFEEAAPVEVTEEAEPENVEVTQVEVMNGDPTVVVPTEEAETPVEEETPQEEIKPKTNVFKRMFGYIWNGQEMDY